jgi:murein L,D-transpeptidase YafK
MPPVARLLVLLLLAVLSLQSGHDANAPTSPPKPDHILVIKSTRTLSLLNGTQILKSYKVALGSQPIGAKDRQGDHKTPQGTYFVDSKLDHSQFHHALHLSYPSPADRERAKKLGLSPGGDVEIHGLPEKYAWLGSQHRLTDWTDGCIALTNAEIDEIFLQISVGTPVEIRP